MMCFDAVACLRKQHRADYDVPGAYLQGEQQFHERRLYRPPPEARKFDERGIEILWLSNHPFYGQTDAGAIWNRTMNTTLTSDREPDGCALERCPQDPSVYGANVDDGCVHERDVIQASQWGGNLGTLPCKHASARVRGCASRV